MATSTVLVQLHGGLGNQLFQAAAGLALADRLAAELAVDLSRFRDRSLRAYALSDLPIGARIWPGERAGIVERLHGDVMIGGFFQSPRCFAGQEALIRARFDASSGMDTMARARAARVSGDDSVALDIRRGDYASDPKAAAVHGVLDDDYYTRVLAHVRAKVGSIRLFVFSDDAAQARDRAARWGGEAMAGASALEDLWLMSQCRHHIIANSSFSWWSAWLDGRAGGERVAPVRWFVPGHAATKRTDDLFPTDWVRL